MGRGASGFRSRGAGPGLAALGEEGLIRILGTAAPRGRGVLLGPGDDAAAVRTAPASRLLLTADLLAEGVHFRRSWAAPADLGWKLAAVNASDVGAMGGRPLWALLSVALPADLDRAFVTGLRRGLRAGARHFGFALLGGDTSASASGLVLSLALAGAAGPRLLRRRGARPGDLLCVTGDLGGSTLGLDALERSGGALPAALRPVARRHLRPRPPVDFGGALARTGFATAAIDLSDGLVRDLTRLATASATGAAVGAARIPIAPATRRAARVLGRDAAEAALHGGEEYELLFTVRPRAAGRATALGTRHGVRVTVIGEILPRRRGVLLVRADGVRERIRPRSWEHFGPNRAEDAGSG